MAKLELLASGPGTGKTTACIDLFRRQILRSPAGLDSRSYFVLPNREHADRIQNLVLKKDTPGLFNVHILTLQDLTRRLVGARAAFGPGEMTRQALLRAILTSPENDFPFFERVRDLKGFHALLSETLREFGGALLTVAEFEKRAQRLLSDPVFRMKFRDLSVLMKVYEEKLRALGLAEPEEDILRLMRGSPEIAEKADLVIFDGFYHFSRAQQELIGLVARHTDHVVVTLTLPSAHSQRAFVFEYPRRTREFLLSRGFREGGRIAGASRRCQNKALEHLETNLFLEKPVVYPKPQQAFQCLEAESPRGEMEMIAREIRRLHREESFHWSDFCVIFRSFSGHEKTLESVFTDYELPFSVHERKRLTDSGLARYLQRLLRALSEGWDPEEAAHLGHASYAPEAEGLLKAKDGLLASKGNREFSRRLIALTGSLKLPEGHAGARDEAARASVRELWRVLEVADEDLAGFSLPGILSEALRLLEAGLFSLKPSGKNRVQVYDVIMALPKEYKVVFIGGLLQGAFPKESVEHALLKDEERRALGDGQPLLEERGQRSSGEHYFFYMAVTRARQRLYLSYPLKDEKGRPTLPSFFIEEALACFGSVSTKRESGHPAVFEDWQATREAERGAAYALFSGPATAKPTRSLLSLASAWRADPRFRRLLDAGSRSAGAVIGDARALEHFAKEKGPYSATELKALVTCAFQHFSKYSLGLTDPPGERQRQWTGTLLHDVLEAYFSSGGGFENVAAAREELWRLLESKFPESPLTKEPLFRQKILLERMRRTLTLFARRESQLRASRDLHPRYFEAAFGKKVGGRVAKLGFLPLADGKILLQGALDRVDVTPDGKKALVIDYKLGTRDLNKDLSKGLELQLPIYLLATKRLLGLEPLGAELRFLEKGEEAGIYAESAKGALGLAPSSKKTKSPEEFKKILADTEMTIAEAVGRLQSGDIAVRSRSCDYCVYNALCRYETWRLLYREMGLEE